MFNVTEANTEGSKRQDSRGSAGVREHGMYGEKDQELGRPCLFRRKPVGLTNRRRGRLMTDRESD
ncbi:MULTISPECIES: hypothetical protein [unclassified Dehalobacter]|uniref:hypothetical protein n=1 Tax=unclassified Dehalobacter TaxID=2635733 RepID=UPI0002FE0FE5|nr:MULTISPECIES: hypothetical protein [unclassified Dehalobacter]